MKTETPSDASRILHYTLVALFGMLAGIVIGCVASGSASSGAADPEAHGSRSRAMESHP